MKACVIGGKGKVGNYLLPLLVQSGYQVTTVSRGKTGYYRDCPEFKEVKELILPKDQKDFNQIIAKEEYDVIVDMICFDHQKMLDMIESIKDHTDHFVVCGSLWYHGASNLVPVREEDCRNPFGEYGIQKLAMSDDLKRLWKEEGFHGTIVHPGHICAPRHDIINPQGNSNKKVFTDLRDGNELLLPNNGLETLHHVHAGDVAGIMHAVILKGEGTYGEDFHAAASQAMSLRGYAEHVAGLFGKEAKLIYKPFEAYKKCVSERDAAMTWDHISRSPTASLEKVKRVLNYETRSPFETVDECIESYHLI